MVNYPPGPWSPSPVGPIVFFTSSEPEEKITTITTTTMSQMSFTLPTSFPDNPFPVWQWAIIGGIIIVVIIFGFFFIWYCCRKNSEGHPPDQSMKGDSFRNCCVYISGSQKQKTTEIDMNDSDVQGKLLRSS